MSYARFGWNGSDVYIFLDSRGCLTCCGCLLQTYEWVEEPDALFGGHLEPVGEIIQHDFYTTAEMLTHLDAHRAAGHTVEDATYSELRRDATENDAWIAQYRKEQVLPEYPDANE